MSQRANGDAPTPYRRSTRISTKASSVAEESATATAAATASGSARRNRTTLTQVKARRSNAYGASGRVGNPDKLTAAPATGFAQAFKNQLDKSGIQSIDQEGDEIDSVDELGSESQSHFSSTLPHNNASNSKAAPGYSFMDSDDLSPSEDDVAASVGNTSKSFGLSHEAGMLVSRDPFAGYPIRDEPRSSPFVKPVISSRRPPTRAVNGVRPNGPTPVQAPAKNTTQDKTPTPTKNVTKASVQTQAQLRANVEQIPARSTPPQIEQSVDDLIAEEQARLQREGPPLPQPQRQSDRRRPHRKDPGEVNAWIGDVESFEEDEPVWRWKKSLTWMFWILSGCLFIGWVASTMMTADSSDSALGTPSLLKAVGSRIVYTYERVTDAIMPPGMLTDTRLAESYKNNGDDTLLWGRMANMENRNDKRFQGMRETIDELKKELPGVMIIRRHQDGSAEITDEFWRALTAKAHSDPEWTKFLEDTKAKLAILFDNAAHSERSPTESWPQAASREEFIKLVESRYENLTVQVNKRIEDAIRAQSAQFKTMMKAEAKKTMLDQIRLNALAQANLVANYELHLTKPNYFSPGLGATIDPDLSSVTFDNKPGRIAELARRLSGVPSRNPPIAALTKWEEPGDCWCSANQAPELSGQAQLAVRVPRPVIPKQVTIEHVPMSMMPARKIDNAPRDMELWVQTNGPIKPYYSHREVNCRSTAPESAGGEWKCLGSFKYNIHASNHLQTFDLAGEPSEPVSRVVLRVTSNWGASHTCLYQVRLHGTDAETDYEYPVNLMD
jgi:SUN domain-containing protein 1/2